MLYALKFRRKMRRGNKVAWTVRVATTYLGAVAFLAVTVFGLAKLYDYVRYTMPHPHSSAVWGRQFGSLGNDVAEVITADRDGNVYVAGQTDGGLFGKSSDHTDAFIAKYSASGDFVWGRQFSSNGDETVSGLAADSAGNLYLVGGTEGDLFDHNAGLVDSPVPHHDAFIVKLDRSGNRLWDSQFGTDADDMATAVAVDNRDNVYVVGNTDGSLFAPNAGPDTASGPSGPTGDVWVERLDANGVRSWATQFGSPGDDSAESVTVDRLGDVYVAGGTYQLFPPASGDRDAFIAKVDSSGNLKWGTQLSVRQDSFPAGVACDSAGNAYLSADMVFGQSTLLASPGVAKFSPSGVEEQRVQMSSTLNDDVLSAVPDSEGGITLVGSVAGYTFTHDRGASDGFVSRYDADGTLKWTRHIGGRCANLYNSAYVDPSGFVYCAGKAEDTLFAQASGSDDAIAVKYSPTGETDARPITSNGPN